MNAVQAHNRNRYVYISEVFRSLFIYIWKTVTKKSKNRIKYMRNSQAET